MSIKFKTIRYKNILSTGNTFIEIFLDKKRVTILSGKNGAGKSTVLEALSFALYGKPLRKINKPQLVNTVNKKDLLVEVEFSTGGNDYLVRRGIKPNIFEIMRNGEMLQQDAASKDQQEYLEEQILKIDFKSFNQIVVLGSVKYTPFMQLDAAVRREVIEDLLDIKIFGVMNTLLKERISNNKSEIMLNKSNIELTQSKIDMSKQHNESILKMKQQEADKIKAKISECLSAIEQKNSEAQLVENKIKSLLETISDKEAIKKRYDTMSSIALDFEHKMRGLDGELGFYHDHDNCPTCKQGIDREFKATIISDKNAKSQEMKTGLETLKDKMRASRERLEEISVVEKEIRSLELKSGEISAGVKMLKSNLKSYSQELSGAEKEVEMVDQSKIIEYESEITSLLEERQKLSDEKDSITVVSSMLKDGGIKTKIIKQYIPIMNKMINKYLADFELFVDFQLDENFNETIKSRFRDTFSYASFSEGEKLRIDLSILLTWRSLAKMRNSVSTNLLILDEVLDSGADSEGVESLIEILNRMDTNDNIMIISHRGHLFQDKIPDVIHFEKVKNFSQIAA
jgi:DNA repair exonuclease SbcCD ATPase subunit